jgi:hypothetical protein
MRPKLGWLWHNRDLLALMCGTAGQTALGVYGVTNLIRDFGSQASFIDKGILAIGIGFFLFMAGSGVVFSVALLLALLHSSEARPTEAGSPETNKQRDT